MDKKVIEFERKIKTSFNSLFNDVNSFIGELKKASSEEILNGSVSKAQDLLSQILPYEEFYGQLKKTKKSYDQLFNSNGEVEDDEGIEKEAPKSSKVKKETVEIEEDSEDFTSQEKFRIPILKSLIYLGGSAEEEESTEFVKKELKSKLSKADFEVPDDEEHERWLISVYCEVKTMVDEGLLVADELHDRWEITQKGIDYLGKYGK